MSFKFTKSNLNFDVYAVASKPTTPGANNDIAIITSVPMPNWIMSPDKPSGRPRSDGDVWIQYSVKGETFNSLKNNSMMIATISAWQYVDGAWVDVEAVSCQNGEWVKWIPQGALYWEGYECTDVTGGWIAKAVDWNSGTSTGPVAPTVVREGNKLVMSQIETGCGVVMTTNKIDLSGYKTLHFKGKFYASSTQVNAPAFVSLRLFSNIGTYVTDNLLARLDNNLNPEVAEYSISLEGLSTTSVYVAFTLVTSYAHVELEKMWLKK